VVDPNATPAAALPVSCTKVRRSMARLASTAKDENGLLAERQILLMRLRKGERDAWENGAARHSSRTLGTTTAYGTGFSVHSWPSRAITAANISIPSQRFWNRRFSFDACWLLS
jgi:hypothetical protein